jgi:hypothetical protein
MNKKSGSRTPSSDSAEISRCSFKKLITCNPLPGLRPLATKFCRIGNYLSGFGLLSLWLLIDDLIRVLGGK